MRSETMIEGETTEPRSAPSISTEREPSGAPVSVSPSVVEERAARAARAKEKPGSSTDRVRKHREKKKQEQETAASEPSEADIAESGAVFALLYDLALVPVTKGRLAPLQPEQASRAGRVLAPLVAKYAPLLGDYQREIAAVLVLGSILRENWQPGESEDPYGEQIETQG